MKTPVAILAALLIVVRAFAADQPDTVTVDPDTEAVIHSALTWLAQQQGLDGSWSQTGMGGEPIAMTGYALMAFIATGNLPDDGEYGRNVTSGMQYLLNQIQPDGIFRAADRGKYMYNHGIATVALSELYGETHSPVLRQRLEQLVNVILGGQSQLGGWRYTPNSRDADISVTVLQVAALRAAKNAGLAVPQETIDKAVAYIGQCFDDPSGGFTYQPRNRQPGFARTAAAIYSLQVCGRYDDPMVGRGSDFLFTHDKDSEEWWPYGCYYAAPAQYMIGGDTWRRWYAEMKTRLMSTAIREGDTVHWDERRSRQLGPVYDTAVFITILAMPYHYVPLYQR